MAVIQAGSHERLMELSQRTYVPGWRQTVVEADVDEMTVAELRDYAAANDIDLGGATKKADILAAIKEA